MTAVLLQSFVGLAKVVHTGNVYVRVFVDSIEHLPCHNGVIILYLWGIHVKRCQKEAFTAGGHLSLKLLEHHPTIVDAYD